MLDLRWIRDEPEAFDAAMARRGLEAQSQAILSLDKRHRGLLTRAQELQAQRNALSKQIGQAKQQGMNGGDNLLKQVAAIKDELATLEYEERDAGETLDEHLAALPNVFAPEVPPGSDDADNVEVRRIGTPRTIPSPKDHVELGERIGLMDVEAAARMSGARFTVLTGGLARMERALGQFMLDLATTEHGYRECSVPYLVREQALFGSGQLPKFSEDLFRTTDDRWLIPTSEVSLANLVAEAIVPTDALPMRLTALTPCFRSEAGSAGKDTRGMIRQHQFHKVEMVSITAPEESDAELERMTGCAETVLQRLDLPFRTVLKCAGDTGFTATKSFDVEVWIPAQNTYREISSCSNCGDFQARRLKARYRPEGQKETRFVHTLNGSGVAVGRALVAVMENYQQPDGSIAVPEALLPYMGGLKRIERNV